MEKLTAILRPVFGIGIFLIVMIISFKGCFVSIWQYPKTIEAYQVEGADSRYMLIVFFPQSQTMIWYIDPNEEFTEGILSRMKGAYGTHYIGPIWRVEGPGIFVGLRWYGEGIKPVVMEMKVLNKYMQGRAQSSSPPIGETSYSEILFANDQINFQGSWLDRVDIGIEEIERLYNSIPLEDDPINFKMPSR
jgi:hypothetical protein